MRVRSSCRTSRLSKMSTRELATGSALQIPLKLQSRFFLIEFDDDETPPRAIRSGVRRQARIVCGQPRVEIRCHAYVVLSRSGDALENVDEALGRHADAAAKSRPLSNADSAAVPYSEVAVVARWRRYRCWRFCDSEPLQPRWLASRSLLRERVVRLRVALCATTPADRLREKRESEGW